MTPQLHEFWLECRNLAARLPPEYHSAIRDTWELCVAEIEDGESETNEIELARQALQELREKYDNN